MPMTPETHLHAAATDARWCRRVRIATLASMVLVCAPLLPLLRSESALILLLTLPFQVPYLLILWRLRAKPQKSGLALAVGTGSVLFVPSVLLVFGAASESWQIAFCLGLFALAQAVLVGSAIKTYYADRQDIGDWRILVRGIVDPAVYLGIFGALFAMSIPGILVSRRVANESSAVASIKSISMCAATYRRDHPNQGFPANLALMSPRGNCIDQQLTGGHKDGYQFVYRPGPADAVGRIRTYTIDGRPTEYGQTGRRSFFF